MNLYSDSTLTINLGAIADNYRFIRSKVNSAEVSSVVKADAYGLGVEKIAPVLHEAGCKKFFVANLDEGLNLRNILPGAFIAVFNGLREGQESVFVKNNIIPVVNSLEQLELIGDNSCIVHFDTGINRLGIDYKDAVKTDLLSKNILFLMSHYACADNKEHPKNAEQLDKIQNLKKIFKGYNFSLANSYGIFAGEKYHGDIVRPGIALYGGNPTLGCQNPMKPVINLTSRILQIREIDSKCTVGYGASYEMPAGSTIATVPVGYADGYFRCLGNSGFCAINGKKVSVVGRVSMDLITLDISSFAKGELKTGDEVELIGENITLNDVADCAGTIDYEVLTNIGRRYKKIYIK